MHESVILVRHGHLEGTDQPRFRGRQHLQQTAVGLQQAEQTTAYLNHLVRPDAIVCSPMARCIATGAIVGQPTGLAPMPDEGLVKLDHGDWQGKPVAEMNHSGGGPVIQGFPTAAAREAAIPAVPAFYGSVKKVRCLSFPSQ